MILIGVALNFPVQLTLCPLVAAIAAGNCAVIKPPSMSPAFCKLIEELIPKYFDNDAIRCFQPQGEDRSLIKRTVWSNYVHRFCTRWPYRNEGGGRELNACTAWTGGKNPCVVTEDAILDATANRIVDAKYMNAGQICVNVITSWRMNRSKISWLKSWLRKSKFNTVMIRKNHWLTLASSTTITGIVWWTFVSLAMWHWWNRWWSWSLHSPNGFR